MVYDSESCFFLNIDVYEWYTLIILMFPRHRRSPSRPTSPLGVVMNVRGGFQLALGGAAADGEGFQRGVGGTLSPCAALAPWENWETVFGWIFLREKSEGNNEKMDRD